MNIIYLIFISLLALLLIGIILIQKPKGEGLATEFGNIISNQFIGVKESTSFFEKATWILAFLMMLSILGTNFMVLKKKKILQDVSNLNIKKAKEKNILKTQKYESDQKKTR